MRLCFFLLILQGGMLFSAPAWCQDKTDDWLMQLLRDQGSPQLQHILNNPDSFQYQLIYTQINRNAENKAICKNYYLHVNQDRYFYPASTVKLPVAMLALAKLDTLRSQGARIDMHTTMLTDTAYSGQTLAHGDTTAPDGYPSIGQYIRKIMLVSDDDAYNRLYEWVGQQYLNEALWQRGYKDVVIRHRFTPMTDDEHRHTNPIRFVENGRLLYRQPAATSTLVFDTVTRPVGKAYIDQEEEYINEPMDFAAKNCLPLESLQSMLQYVVFPNSMSAAAQFGLRAEDHVFLLYYMGAYPRENRYPAYDSVAYPDHYAKFYLPDAYMGSRPNLRSFSKAGWAYGFMTDAAYLVDYERNLECMLTAVIYVNRNEVLNDDQYEYETVGRPFFQEIARIILNYEASRKRPRKPDFTAIKFDY